MTAILRHDEGAVRVAELGNGRRRVTVEPADSSAFVSRAACETGYPVELIRRMLELRGPRALCDDILRDEDDTYIALDLRYGVLAYMAADELVGKRLLDFGCGTAASTVVLARMLPQTELVGVDLDPGLLAVAELRADHLGVAVEFVCSPGPERLPDGIGSFDFISLFAVYEHLLPSERRILLGQLWELLVPGGILLVNGTPNRWYPVEHHTTGLPLLNYLPDRVAFRVTRRFSRQWGRSSTGWDGLLRSGIRGATRGEILSILNGAGAEAELLTPTRFGCRDEIDIWYAISMIRNPRWFKPAMRVLFKIFARLTARVPTPYLTIAIRRHAP